MTFSEWFKKLGNLGSQDLKKSTFKKVKIDPPVISRGVIVQERR